MEYLMTYGWAILIIAVILAALFELGVFGNSGASGPKASPGSCEVYRPQGASTTFDISLEGQCSGLEPEFVAKSSIVSGSGIDVGSNPTVDIVGQNITITAWIDTLGYSHDIVDKEGQYGMKMNCVKTCDLEWDTGNSWVGTSYGSFNYKTWTFVAVTMQSEPGGSALKSWYVNGALVGTQTVTGSITGKTSSLWIGAISNGCAPSSECFNGTISNVQLYNAPLTSGEVQALYQEGIGGAPVSPQQLVGWWPLNDNPNDYSGNLDSGTSSYVSYTSSWESEYTPP